MGIGKLKEVDISGVEPTAHVVDKKNVFRKDEKKDSFPREQILKNVWGYDYYGDLRSVDVTIRRIREKIEDNTAEPKYIITKRGIGYYV